MIDIRSDNKKNRVYFTAVHPSRTELKQGLKQFEAACMQMRTNFTFLSDLRQYGASSTENGDLILMWQERAWAAGMAMAARVIPPDFSDVFEQEVLGIERNLYPVENVFSLDEAETILDNYSRQIPVGNHYSSRDRFRIIGGNGSTEDNEYRSLDTAIRQVKRSRKRGDAQPVVVNFSINTQLTK